jgi:putative transcriptional regulator
MMIKHVSRCHGVRIYARQEIFKRARIEKGFSQRELARQSGLSHAYISLIERAVKSVGPATAKKLSTFLEKEADELFRIE